MKKRISKFALASFIISICSGFFPLLMPLFGIYFQVPATYFASIVGIFLSVLSFILGVIALVVISMNKSALSGYLRAIIGIIMGICSFYAWLNMVIYTSRSATL